MKRWAGENSGGRWTSSQRFPGPCCICGQSFEHLRNLFILPLRAPQPGTGWACLFCDLPPNGAIALTCDACAELAQLGEAEILFAVDGYPISPARVPIPELSGEQVHDESKHRDE